MSEDPKQDTPEAAPSRSTSSSVFNRLKPYPSLSYVFILLSTVTNTITGVMVRELWQAFNLDPDNAVTIDGSTIAFGGITIQIAEPVPGTRTFTRL